MKSSSIQRKRPNEPTERPFVLINENVHDVAERSRRAAFEFFAGANAGWGAKDLATWLVERYAVAARQRDGTAIVAGMDQLRRSREGRLEEAEAAALLYRTRERVLETLQLREWERPDFAQSAVSGHLVAGAYDGLGGIGYVAIARPRMRLLDRVMSLVFADCLTRPADYQSLLLCEACGEMSFKWEPAHLESCEERPRPSCVVPRWATPVPGAAMVARATSPRSARELEDEGNPNNPTRRAKPVNSAQEADPECEVG